MSTIWIVSLAFAWVVIALLTVCVVTLLRQVGELRARLDGDGGTVAGGALPAGPQLYDAVAPVELGLLGAPGATVAVGGEQERPALLVVHAPGCSSCADIEQALEVLARERPDVTVVSVVALARPAASRHVAEHAPRGLPSVALADVPSKLVPDGLPALVAIAREGLVAAIGAPDCVEQLREAADIAAGAVLVAGPDSVRATDWGRAVPAWGVDDAPAPGDAAAHDDAPALDVVQVDGSGRQP